MTLIDGKQTAASIKADIAEQVEKLIEAGGKRPHLAAILVGFLLVRAILPKSLTSSPNLLA